MSKIIIIITFISFFGILNSQNIRSFDGSVNNIVNPEWGSVDEQLLTTTLVQFGDSIKSLSGAERPNARLVSNFVSDQSDNISDELFLTQMVWVFGQFIDHDIIQTEIDLNEPIIVKIPDGDYFFYSGSEMKFYRTKPAPETGTSKANPRKYLNKSTAFLDASNIYGTSKSRNDRLRTFKDGKLKISEEKFLPWNTISGEFNDKVDNSLGEIIDETHSNEKLFFAGDERINDNPLLISLHTVFVREHNRLCDDYKILNPDFSDEEIFQKARRKLIAYLQVITFNEWLPVQGIILPTYSGYNSQINPGISNLFSTAAFRLEGTLQSDEIPRAGIDGNNLSQGILYLKNSYFKPSLINISGGIEPFLTGSIKNNQEKLDLKAVDATRNFLYGDPILGGLDIVSINIMRSRERGIPDFNTIRRETGFEEYKEFSDLTSDKGLAATLNFLYKNINNLDAWTGLLAEDRAENSLFGQTLKKILTEQFTRLRDGDRFYFENDIDFSNDEISEIKATRLRDLIIRNTDIKDLQANVFTTFDQSREDPGLKHENLAALAYPNPVDATLQIKLWMEQEDTLDIYIIDFFGKRVYETRDKMLRGSNELQKIDMSGYPSGIYCILLVTENDHSVIKIVKK
jgi:peroxidase